MDLRRCAVYQNLTPTDTQLHNQSAESTIHNTAATTKHTYFYLIELLLVGVDGFGKRGTRIGAQEAV